MQEAAKRMEKQEGEVYAQYEKHFEELRRTGEKQWDKPRVFVLPETT